MRRFAEWTRPQYERLPPETFRCAQGLRCPLGLTCLRHMGEGNHMAAEIRPAKVGEPCEYYIHAKPVSRFAKLWRRTASRGD